jgi:hypothetical protein
MALVTPVGRLSFPSLWKPTVFVDPNTGNASAPKYECTLLFPPSADLSVLRKACEEKLKEAFNGKVSLKNLAENRQPFHDCGRKSDLEGYEDGWTYVKFSSKKPVRVVRKFEGQFEDLTEDDGKIYAGCWCRVETSSYAYDYLGKGVSLGLNSVLLVKQDTAFGSSGGGNPESAFADAEEYEELEDEMLA